MGASVLKIEKRNCLQNPGWFIWQTRKNRDSYTFDEWVDLDLIYIKKAGAWTDCKIIIQTIGCVLTAQGE